MTSAEEIINGNSAKWSNLSDNEASAVVKNCRQLIDNNSAAALKALIDAYGTGLVMTVGIKDIESIEIVDILLRNLAPSGKLIILSSTSYYLGNDALQHACYEGQNEFVFYWLQSGCFEGKQLLKENWMGENALHMAANVEIFKAVLEKMLATIDGSDLTDFIDGSTLCECCRMGREDVIHYLASEFPGLVADILVQQDDTGAQNVIHYACNEEMTRYLIDVVPYSQRAQLIQRCNDHGRTVLHTASYLSWVNTIKYICTLFDIESLQALILKPDIYGGTSLHCVGNEEIARILIQYIQAEKRADVIASPNRDGVTLLQTACEHGWTDCLSFIFDALGKGKSTELIFQQNILGATALHHAANELIAKAILDTIPKEAMQKLLMVQDKNGKNVLHRVSGKQSGSESIVDLICSLYHEPSGGYKDIIIDMLVQTDKFGNTPLLLAIDKGNAEAAERILAFIDTDTDLDPLVEKLFKHCNNLKQNVFHVALLHPFSDTLIQILVEYCPRINLQNVITPDSYGNTPINYVAGRFQTREFANFLMRLSLPDRRKVILAQNKAAIDCRSIVGKRKFDRKFYQNYVLCRNKSIRFDSKSQDDLSVTLHRDAVPDNMIFGISLPIKDRDSILYGDNADGLVFVTAPDSSYLKIEFDERIFRVMKYAMNEYAVVFTYNLTDQTVITDKAATDGTALMEITSKVRELDTSDHKDTYENTYSTPVNFLYIDEDETDLTQNQLHRKLFEMDRKDQHGNPKVIVRKLAADEGRRLSVPAPSADFLIISLLCHKSATGSSQITSQIISDLFCKPDKVDFNRSVEELASEAEIKEVRVNTTLASHVNNFPSTDKAHTDNHIEIVTRDMKRRALIVSYTYHVDDNGLRKTRDNWNVQYDDAKRLLGCQLAFELEELLDPSATSLLDGIEKFATSTKTDLMALVIMGHGDLDGNMSDVERKPISVQEAIDKFSATSSPTSTPIPKIVFLAFCRGGLREEKKPKASRTYNSWESTVLPSLLDSSEFEPVNNPLRSGERAREWKIHPFPDVVLPLHCYLMYSTLPDSKSPREQCLFKVMSDHLEAIIKLSGYEDHRHFEPTRQQGSVHSRPEAISQQAPECVVDILDLFIDASRLVRESSRSTQYTNHAYTVDKNISRLFIELPKPNGTNI